MRDTFSIMLKMTFGSGEKEPQKSAPSTPEESNSDARIADCCKAVTIPILQTRSSNRPPRTLAKLLPNATIDLHRVPGAFEIPVVIESLCRKTSNRPNAVIALGVIIRGSTAHADLIAEINYPFSCCFGSGEFDSGDPRGASGRKMRNRRKSERLEMNSIAVVEAAEAAIEMLKAMAGGYRLKSPNGSDLIFRDLSQLDRLTVGGTVHKLSVSNVGSDMAWARFVSVFQNQKHHRL